MKSSSQLFPVMLRSAELVDGIYEDVFDLRVGLSSDPTVRIAITRLRSATKDVCREPVVLLHGAYANRRFWSGGKKHGFAGHLVRAGHEVWLPEMRGHGLSPRHVSWGRNRLSDYAKEDWPAIAAFVAELSGQSAVWVGYGMGALSLGLALVGQENMRSHVARTAFVDCHLEPQHWGSRRPEIGRFGRWWRGRRFEDGVALGLGPEPEPAGVMRELRGWARLTRRGAHPVRDHLHCLDMPALVLSFGQDQANTDRDRRFCGLLGSHQRQFRHCAFPAAEPVRLLAGVTEWYFAPRAWGELSLWLEQGRLPETQAHHEVMR